MRQNLSTFYFAIIMALMFVSCEKESVAEKDSQQHFSIEYAKSYFEQVLDSYVVTKGCNVQKKKSNLFYTGDFTPQWNKAEYSKNPVFEGYDVDLKLPKYRYIVEREYYEDGKIKKFEVPVSQRLVVRQESNTGRMSQYILSLIPDKYYYENKGKKKIKSLSDWENYSGIAIYSSSRTGTPMSIARFINGRLLSKVQMVSTNREEQVINAKRAFSILGPMKIKSKERIITRGPGGGDGGNNGDDGPYNDTPSWVLDNYIDLGGGYYWDGNDIWEDVDGDGIPDYICLPPVIVDGGSGQNPSEPPLVPPTDPFDGVGGGNGSGDSGGGGGGDSTPTDEISDEGMIMLGYRGIEKIETDIIEEDFRVYRTDPSSEPVLTFVNTVVSVENMWTSWLSALKGIPENLKSIGRKMGYVGMGVSALASSETVMILLDEGWSHLTTGEKLELISLGLQGVGLATSLLVPVIGPPLGASIGSVGTIVGIVSLGLNYNMNSPLRIDVGNNLSFTIYIV